VKNRKVRGFFVTGTGTGVGKTYVCKALAAAFSTRMRVSYMKPVQTGCFRKRDGSLSAPDFESVRKSGVLVTGNEDFHVPYRFLPSCSPHLAARKANKKISLKKVSDNLNSINGLFGESSGCVLVEGAGGVLVPLNDAESIIHLIVRLELPVILVATSGLGTLNHTFLSICALKSCGVTIAGVVMNSPEKSPVEYIYKDNRETIRAFARPAPFLEIKYKFSDTKRTRGFCNELAKRYL
jgi:dethiobiotin synthase